MFLSHFFPVNSPGWTPQVGPRRAQVRRAQLLQHFAELRGGGGTLLGFLARARWWQSHLETAWELRFSSYNPVLDGVSPQSH
jgi:hypothetical protein